MKKLIKTRLHRFLNGYFEARLKELGELGHASHEQLAQLTKQVAELQTKLDALTSLPPLAEQTLQVVKANRDNIEDLRRQLFAVRQTDAYDKIFIDENPLISVRIATYNRPKELVERAITSVLRQTYQNFEIIVVGDNSPPETEENLKKVGDKRIRYYNFPFRNVYPDDVYYRYLVAGSPGMNMGAHLARGSWIAPLDDDDEFTEDHLEVLLRLALKTRSEMVYGALVQKNLVAGVDNHIYSFPPEFGHFSFQGAMYMKLLDFFEYDQQSWVMREAGDWNLARRMVEAGVRMAGTDRVVGTLFTVPHQHKPKE